MHITHQNPTFPFLAHWLSVVAGTCLVACVQSPQAAVPAQTPPLVPMAWGSAVDGCAGGERLRAAVESMHSELQAQGLVLKTSCQVSQGALAVQLEVVDGLRASKVLRGPLAEGEAVDMGTPAGMAGAKAASHNADLSPDVQHNRQWLWSLMARHQFDNLPDAWWRFAQKAAPQPALAELDLAAR